MNNMKKIVFFIFLSFSLFVNCKGKDIEQKIIEFNTEVESRGDYLKSNYDSLIAQGKTDSADSLYSACLEEFKSFCMKTLKHNKNNALGLEAYKQLSGVLEPSELQEAISLLGPDIKQDKLVQRDIKSIDAMLATGEGKMFLDFEVDGVKFSDYIGKGKYVLVDFWASWCRPCREEIPYIADVYKKYAGDKFDVLSVAVWDKPEDTKLAAEKHGVVWNQIINAQRIPTDLYGIQGIPQIMLFAPDGTILKRDLRGQFIESEVRRALGL